MESDIPYNEIRDGSYSSKIHRVREPPRLIGSTGELIVPYAVSINAQGTTDNTPK